MKIAQVAFDDIIPRWQEACNRSGTGLAELRASDPSHHVGQGRATHRTQLVMPRISDFVADVQLCAYRVLSPIQLTHFISRYRDIATHSDTGNEEKRDLSVRVRLGSELIRSGLYPFQCYISPFDQRGNSYSHRMRRLAQQRLKRAAA